MENDSGFSKEIQSILITFKNTGGQQETAKRLVEELVTELSESENSQDKAYDILDIVTNWCSCEMKVWD